ncbi:hypothetical protein BC941DRAFT_86045 [Chlamydoabsidia padenii]|nr:hypothetical protein BC941DRAFT_86045 [Chlamydoabsidia padenii]
MFTSDLDQTEKVIIRLYMKTRSSSLLKSARKKSTEKCLGQQVLQWNLRPMKKQVNRMTFHHEGEIYQVMMILGTFITERAQSLLSNQSLYADYLTIYLRGGTIPRWQRYWGVLHATYLVLYDFEYKKSKSPKEVIPLQTLESVFHPSNREEEEQMIDVGRLGLALQFTPHYLLHGGENRMYVLPDNDLSGQQWEDSFQTCATLVEEFQTPAEHTFNGEPAIPSKYLW